MRNFKGKNRWSNVMQSTPVLIILAALVLVFAVSLVSFVGKLEDTVKNKKIAEEKIVELEKQKSDLTLQIDKLNTSQGVEDSIREKFGLAKDGEGMIVVLDDQNKTDTTAPPKPKGFWPWVKNIFKK